MTARRRRSLCFVALAVVGAALVGCAAGDSSNALMQARAELVARDHAFADAAKSGTVDETVAFMTDDVVLHTINGDTVRGVDAVREGLEGMRAMGMTLVMTQEEASLIGGPNHGYTVGSFAFVGADGGELIAGRHFVLWERNDRGEWVCSLEFHQGPPFGGAGGPGGPGEGGPSADAGGR